MKNVITFFALFTTCFLVCYLIGSFGQASFNINDWNIDDRKMVGLLGGFLSFCASAIITGMLSDSEGSTDDSIRD